jgi:hypothetical protein
VITPEDETLAIPAVRLVHVAVLPVTVVPFASFGTAEACAVALTLICDVLDVTVTVATGPMPVGPSPPPHAAERSSAPAIMDFLINKQLL